MLIMHFFGFRSLLTGYGVIILSAETEPTMPAPGATTALTDVEYTICFEAAREYVVTGIIFETPALAPGTGFGIGHLLRAGVL